MIRLPSGNCFVSVASTSCVFCSPHTGLSAIETGIVASWRQFAQFLRREKAFMLNKVVLSGAMMAPVSCRVPGFFYCYCSGHI